MCEWERENHSRIKQTIHPEYYKPRFRVMADWDPPLFSRGGFEEYLEVQKVMAMMKIWRFAFSPGGNALKDKAARGRNFFVRGPAGSGKGLLAATIKLVAAGRGMTATPLPSDYDVLKGFLAQAEEYGGRGDAARVELYSRYESPTLMVVEDARAEMRFQFRDGNEKTRRVRGHDFLDALLARRASRPGTLLMTSSNFIGEIRDSMGDRMHDMLLSPKTNLLVMLGPDETSDLRTMLSARRSQFQDVIDRLVEVPQEKNRLLTERMGDCEEADLFLEALYFEEAFPRRGARAGENNLSWHEMCESSLGHWEQASLAAPVWERFVSAREERSAEYKEGLDRARAEAIQDCRGLSPKLSRREMIEVGKMLSLAARATGDPGLIDSWKAEAAAKRDLMSGKSS